MITTRTTITKLWCSLNRDTVKTLLTLSCELLFFPLVVRII